MVFVPHDTLHYLPFHALPGRDGYLVETRAVTYAPSASALVDILQRSAPARETILAMGNPDLGIPSLDLPGASSEVHSIKGALPADRAIRKTGGDQSASFGEGTAKQRAACRGACGSRRSRPALFDDSFGADTRRARRSRGAGDLRPRFVRHETGRAQRLRHRARQGDARRRDLGIYPNVPKRRDQIAAGLALAGQRRIDRPADEALLRGLAREFPPAPRCATPSSPCSMTKRPATHSTGRHLRWLAIGADPDQFLGILIALPQRRNLRPDAPALSPNDMT